MKTTVISSAEKISNNPDLLIEILIRLPAKDLVEFKLVSKHWLSLISDPHFCLRHTRFHLSPTAFVLNCIYYAEDEKTGPLFYPLKKIIRKETSVFDVLPLKHIGRAPFFDYLNSEIDILQSCNGLLLCKSLNSNLMSGYFICNPVTMKSKELSLPARTSKGFLFSVRMAFDPLKSSHYKVICVRQAADLRGYCTVDVYSSETDAWSLSRINFPIKHGIGFGGAAVFCNGRIHSSSRSAVDSIYVDVEKETWGSFPMLKSTPEEPIDRIYFGEFRSALYASVTYFAPFHLEMRVFEMASDYSEWTRKYVLNLENITKDFPEIRSNSRLCSPLPAFSDVWITQSEKDDEPKVVVWVENKVIFFDSNNETWKPLRDLRVSSSWFKDREGRLKIKAYQYIETLACV